MKELTHKLKAKPVGVDASVRPFFKGMPKDNKGITLIALIITIIVMMILVAVTVTFTIGENGIFRQTKEAKAEMIREQEKEELGAAVLAATGIDRKVNFEELDKSLPEGFTGSNGTYTSKTGNKFTVKENGEIENLHENGETENSQEIKLIELTHTISKEELEENVYINNVKFNVRATMSADEYQTIKEQQINYQQKEIQVMENLSKDMDALRDSGIVFTKLDDATLHQLNNAEMGIKYDELKDWLTDTTLISVVIEAIGNPTRESVKKEELNALFYGDYIDFEGTELTNQHFIETFYNENLADYTNKYNEAVSNLKMYLVKNEEVLIYDNITATTEGIELNDYEIVKNGKYKFIIKNQSEEIVAKSTIEIKDLAQNASIIGDRDEWQTNGNGAITKYLGSNTNVIVPKYVASEKIQSIQGPAFEENTSLVKVEISYGITRLDDYVFYGCTSLESVILPESVTYLGCAVFGRCTSLETITIPNSVTGIFSYDDELPCFSGCSNLKKIDFAPGDNPIPKYYYHVNWGAPSTVVITKLTK